MSDSPYAWVNLNPFERGRWVRRSLRDCFNDKAKLAELFQLTPVGVERILAGDQWRPEYSLDANPVSVEGA